MKAAAVAVTHQLDHQAHQDQMVWMEQTAQKDHQDVMDQMRSQEDQYLLPTGASNVNHQLQDLKAQLVPKDLMVCLVQEEPTECQELLDLKVVGDQGDQQELADPQEKEEQEAQLEQQRKFRDHLAQLVHQEQEDHPDLQDHLAQLEDQALQDQWDQLVWQELMAMLEPKVRLEWRALKVQQAAIKTVHAVLHLSALQAISRSFKRF